LNCLYYYCSCRCFTLAIAITFVAAAIVTSIVGALLTS
jgi:hypothetical protein